MHWVEDNCSVLLVSFYAICAYCLRSGGFPLLHNTMKLQFFQALPSYVSSRVMSKCFAKVAGNNSNALPNTYLSIMKNSTTNSNP